MSYGFNPGIQYNFSSKKFALESLVTLINRFDEKQIIDSMKFGQGINLFLKNGQGLRLKAQYYAPVADRQISRYESMLEWTQFL
jgi:hypothetical protein